MVPSCRRGKVPQVSRTDAAGMFFFVSCQARRGCGSPVRVHHFATLTTYIWDALNVNANRTKSLLTNAETCSNHQFLLRQLKNCHRGRKPHAKTVAWSHDVEGHAQKCVERCCELANKKTEQLYKVSSLCLMIIISRKRNLNQLENCQKNAHILP